MSANLALDPRQWARPSDDGRGRWTIGGLLAFLLVLGVLLATFGWLVGPFDLMTFLHAGRQVLEGHSPYDQVTSQVFESGHAFVYPTFVAWAFAPLASLPLHAAVVLYLATSVGAIVMGCALLGRPGVFPAALILTCSTTIIGLQMGTVNALLFLGVAAGWHYRRANPVICGVIIGIVAATKVFLLPLLMWPLMTRRYGTTAAGALSFAAVFGAGAALGPMSPLRYLALLSTLQGNEAIHSWSLSALLDGLGLAGFGTTASSALLVVACALALWIRRRRLTDGQILGMLVLCCLLVSPIVWSSYLLLVAVPLLLTTPGNLALAGATIVSWVIVTPDGARPFRVAVGVALALVVSYLATRPRVSNMWVAIKALPVRRCVYLLGVAAGITIVFILLPGAARSPFPTLVAMSVVAGAAVRSKRGPWSTQPVDDGLAIVVQNRQ